MRPIRLSMLAALRGWIAVLGGCALLVTLGSALAGDSGPAIQENSRPAREWRRLSVESIRMYKEGRLAEAEQTMSRAAEIANRFTPGDPRLPETLHMLGFLYQEHGKLAEAKACYLRAVHLWERLGPAHHQQLSKTIDNLLEVYVLARDVTAADRLIRTRLPEMEGSSDWKDRATFLNMRAALAFRERRLADSELDYQQSLRLWLEHSPEQERNAAVVLLNLSTLYAVLKRHQDALDAAMRAIAILDGPPTYRPDLVHALESAGFALSKLNRYNDAEQQYSRAIATSKEVFGNDHPATGRVIMGYSAVLRRLHRFTEAKALAGDAQRILRSQKPSNATIDTFELGLLSR